MKRIISMLMVLLGKVADEDDALAYSAEEVGTRRSRREQRKEEQQPWDLTVERAAEIIDELPSDVSRESAARIVRGALAAVGIEVSNLERITRARESKLRSEIELVRDRQKEFREKAEEAVGILEEEINKVQEEIRKVQEASATVLAEEEKKIARASVALKDARCVRAFFGFPETEGEENDTPSTQDDTRPFGTSRIQVERRSDPPAGTASRVLGELSSRAKAGCETLPAIEVEEFDEFVTKIRGEGHAQESPRPTGGRSAVVTPWPAEGGASEPPPRTRPSGDGLGKEQAREDVGDTKEELRKGGDSRRRTWGGRPRAEETLPQERERDGSQIGNERKIEDR